MKQAYLLKPQEIQQLWPIIEPILLRAIAYDDVNVPYAVYMDAIMGHLQLWACVDTELEQPIDLVVATRLVRGKEETFLDITYVAGANMLQWYHTFFPMLEEFAKKNHCTSFRFHGRAFFKEWMEPLGWEVKKIITYKKISNDV